MNSSRRWLTVAALIACTIVLGVIGFNALTDKADQSEQKASDTAGAALPLADQVSAACKAGGDGAAELRARGLCVQASDTKDAIKDAGVDPTPAPTKYLPPNPAQLAALVEPMVDTAVYRLCGSDGSCQGQDGKDVTFAMVLRAVRQELPGALLQVCGGSCNGTDGTDGTDGTNGTNGKDAPVIVGSHCDAQRRMVLEMSEGPDIVVDGSRCRPPGVLDPAG